MNGPHQCGLYIYSGRNNITYDDTSVISSTLLVQCMSTSKY